MYPRLSRFGSAIALLAAFLPPAGLVARQQDAQQPPSAPSTETNRPVRSPGNAKWAETIDQARARATSENQLIFIEFTSPKCGACGRMQGLLYPALDFEALLIGMVPVLVQYDSPESKTLITRYRVSESPSILIISPEGRLVFLMQGFKDTSEFYAHVRKDLDSYRQLVKKIDATDRATAPAAEALAIGRDLYGRTDVKGALPWLQRASVAPNPPPGVRENALEGLAAAQLELSDPAASEKSIEALIRIAKDQDMKERAELFRAQLPLAQGNPEEALALYKKFVKDHPKSKYVEQVQALIARFESTAPAAP